MAWVVAVLVVVLALFWQTTFSMVEIWNGSGTYSHGFLILPAFLWLAWGRRRALARMPIAPSWIGLIALSAIGMVWLIGDLAAAATPRQFAVVAMVPAAVAAIFGLGWVRVLAFPLAFLFFAVPFGDSLVPTMIDWTADFTVAALRVSGVPVYREGNNFSIPSGDWSVVDACSGIRYVFACLTVTTLYAWAVYRSTARRLLFVAGALAIAIVANWIRAYTIVMIAHLSNNKLATGIDHFIYGGVFFGVIMAIVFAIGVVWREDQPTGPKVDEPAKAAALPAAALPATSTSTRSLAAALASAATLSVWPWIATGTVAEPTRTSERAVAVEPRGGWTRVEGPLASWQPHLKNPTRVVRQSFAKDGQRVDLHLGVFEHATSASKLTSSANQLVDSEDPRWRLVDRGVRELKVRGEVLPVNTGVLAGRNARVVAWHWYWVDGVSTTSLTRAALTSVLARLGGRSEAATWVTAYTLEGEQLSSAQTALEGFVADMFEPIEGALRTAAR